MRPFHFVGNLKMNPISSAAADRYLSGLREGFAEGLPEGVSVSVAAPFIYLERFAEGLPEGVSLAAQDVFWEREGSYTGEVSPAMLHDASVTLVLIGHSERRNVGRETDGETGKKVSAALSAGLRPILCIGETAEERDAGTESDVLDRQLSAGMEGVVATDADKVIIAYEPRWAIGTDRTPSLGEILEARVVIRRSLVERFGPETAERIPVLYGGSVKASLLGETCFGADMDGVLVGRESLYPREVANMVRMLGEKAAGR